MRRAVIPATVTAERARRAAFRHEVNGHPGPASVSPEDAPGTDVEGRECQTDVCLGRRY